MISKLLYRTTPWIIYHLCLLVLFHHLCFFIPINWHWSDFKGNTEILASDWATKLTGGKTRSNDGIPSSSKELPVQTSLWLAAKIANAKEIQWILKTKSQQGITENEELVQKRSGSPTFFLFDCQSVSIAYLSSVAFTDDL